MTRKYKIIIIFSFLFFFSNELEIFAKTINDEAFATAAIYPTYPVGEPW